MSKSTKVGKQKKNRGNAAKTLKRIKNTEEILAKHKV